MPDNLTVYGFLVRDTSANLNSEGFENRYPELYFVQEGKKVDWDGKLTLPEEYESSLREFLSSNGFSENYKAGGGGRNSMISFYRLLEDSGNPYKVSYFDTCKKPNFESGLEDKTCYFSGICENGEALVINKNGNEGGSFNVKTKRGDLEKKLNDKTIKEIGRRGAEGEDFFINSISNPYLAEAILKKAQKKVYSAVTTYIKREGLKNLLKRSDFSFFSLNEFYWALDNLEIDSKSRKILTVEIRKKVENLSEDISSFKEKLSLNSGVIITLGQYGAVYDYLEEKRWVCLKDDKREIIQNYLKNNKKGTNSAGDAFAAAVVHSLKTGSSLINAVKFAPIFTVKNVLADPIKFASVFTVRNVLDFNNNRVKEDDYSVVDIS